jgi:hypothetical protein
VQREVGLELVPPRRDRRIAADLPQRLCIGRRERRQPNAFTDQLAQSAAPSS